tara:strand:- start:272 stop:454 length:183 start_codon:yes stop_codon:yes gene_type:complete
MTKNSTCQNPKNCGRKALVLSFNIESVDAGRRPPGRPQRTNPEADPGAEPSDESSSPTND